MRGNMNIGNQKAAAHFNFPQGVRGGAYSLSTWFLGSYPPPQLSDNQLVTSFLNSKYFSINNLTFLRVIDVLVYCLVNTPLFNIYTPLKGGITPFNSPSGGNSTLSFGEGGGRGLKNLANLVNLIKIIVQTISRLRIKSAMTGRWNSQFRILILINNHNAEKPIAALKVKSGGIFI